MMRVAVCDGDELVIKQIKRMLENTDGIDRCDGYAGLPLLMDALDAGEDYRLVIMAIEWDGKAEGIETAARIQILNTDTRIIYMTENPLRYIQQMFLQPVIPSGFLIKPVSQELLERYTQSILGEKKESRADCLMLKNKKRILSVRFGEILYMESESHIITVQTKTHRYSCYGRLETFLEQLPENFVQCHKSYIVNMREIRQIKRSGIQIENGLIIPISKSRYSNTKNRYMSYMSDKIRKA